MGRGRKTGGAQEDIVGKLRIEKMKGGGGGTWKDSEGTPCRSCSVRLCNVTSCLLLMAANSRVTAVSGEEVGGNNNTTGRCSGGVHQNHIRGQEMLSRPRNSQNSACWWWVLITRRFRDAAEFMLYSWNDQSDSWQKKNRTSFGNWLITHLSSAIV